jgi:hypothetical protein
MSSAVVCLSFSEFQCPCKHPYPFEIRPNEECPGDNIFQTCGNVDGTRSGNHCCNVPTKKPPNKCVCEPPSFEIKENEPCDGFSSIVDCLNPPSSALCCTPKKHPDRVWHGKKKHTKEGGEKHAEEGKKAKHASKY